MAGSLRHIVADDGTFTMDLIENLGDAHEALEECFRVIYALTGGHKDNVNQALEALGHAALDVDMRPSPGTEDDFDGIDDS